MHFAMHDRHQQLADLAAELAADFATRAAEHDEARSLPMENFAALRDAGFFGIAFPTEWGGLGGDTTGWLAAAEQLAQGCASTALGFNMHHVATKLVWDLPQIPDDVKRRVARLVIDEGNLLCAPLSEPASSSLLPGTFVPTLEARKVPGGLEITGQKMFASVYEGSDYAFMFAHPKDDPNPMRAVGFLMPSQQDGAVDVIDIWDTLGMRATASNQVVINGAFVPEELILCEFEDFLSSWIVQRAHTTWGGYTACYLGVATGMLRWLHEALGSRLAKGYAQPMGYHPSISSSMGHVTTELEAARLLMYRAAWEADTRGPSLETCTAYLQAKLMVGKAIQTLVTVGTTAGGLNSLMRPRGYERALRDAMTGPIMPPNSLACAEMVGLLSMGLDPSGAPSLQLADA